MSHELAPLPPKSMYFMRPLLQGLLKYWLRYYKSILNPDLENESVSVAGKLSHAWTDKRMRYIGPLSRLSYKPKSLGDFPLLVVLSGPEPQRTIFERNLRQQLRYFDLPSLLVQGKPGPRMEQIDGHLQILNTLPAEELSAAMQQAELVVSRSGYSTIMDLWQLGGRVCFVPTPGQTEQEYLAERMAAKQLASCQNQNNFNIARAWEERGHFDGFRPQAAGNSLKQWDEILSS